jgi:photosystem II stability/assembly factor-like uncharacterized protein
MKKAIFISVLLLLSSLEVRSQTFFTTYSLPTISALQIGAFDEEIVCVAASEGIYRTTDHGQSWSKVYGNSDSLISIKDITVLNETTGIVVGEINFISLLLKTTDAGASWERIIIPNTQTFYRATSFGNKISIGADAGRLVLSNDQGNTWNIYNGGMSIWFQEVGDILMTDQSIYMSQYDIKKTENLIHWQTVSTSNNRFAMGLAKSGDRLFSVGSVPNENRPMISYSSNDGVTWNDSVIADHRGTFMRIKFITPEVGFACGNYSKIGGYWNMIYLTMDRGNTWEEIYNDSAGYFSVIRDLSIYGNQIYFCATRHIIRLTVDEPLPVELSSFSSSVSNLNNVNLNWSTTSERNNSCFRIERSVSEIEWVTVGTITGNGTTTMSHEYTFTDRNLNPGTYFYRLKQIDYNGNFEYFSLSNDVLIGIPEKYFLSQNYPNPFNPITQINYTIPEDGLVILKVFDLTGKEIMTVLNEIKTAGYNSVYIDSKNLTTGVYFYKLQSGSFTETKKMTLIK